MRQDKSHKNLLTSPATSYFLRTRHPAPPTRIDQAGRAWDDADPVTPRQGPAVLFRVNASSPLSSNNMGRILA
jgi:hypothetical protein